MNTDLLPANTPMTYRTGPDIAPVAPTSCSITPLPGTHPSWLLSSAGSDDSSKEKYPGVLFMPGVAGVAAPRPILPNTGNVSLAFNLWIDAATLTASNSIETDLLIVQNKLMFAMPLQRLTANGQIQTGGWTAQGAPQGQLAPYRKHRICSDYTFGGAVCEIVNYVCDGATLAIRQQFAATPSTWEEGAYLQFQMGSLPAGLPWNLRLEKIRLKWS